MYTLKLSYMPYISDNFLLLNSSNNPISVSSYLTTTTYNLRFTEKGVFTFILNTEDVTAVGVAFTNYVQNGILFDAIRTGAINFCSLVTNKNVETYYSIINIRYVSSNRFEITCYNTLYNVYGSNTTTFSQIRTIPANNPFIERGYAYDSLFTTDGRCQWSKQANTDMYARAPYDINVNQLEGRTKLCWQEIDKAEGVMLEFSKKPKAWINVYVNTGVDYTFKGANGKTRKVTFEDTPVSKGSPTDNDYPTLPYAILTMPIFDEGTTSFYLPTPKEFEGTGYSTTTIASWSVANLKNIVEQIGESHIYQISVTPYAPNKMRGVLTKDVNNYVYTPTTSSYLQPSDYDIIPLGRYPDDTDGFNICCLKANYVDVSPRYSIPITRTDFQSILANSAYNTMFDYNISKDTMSNEGNPYVLFNTRKMILSDISGNTFDIDLMKIGKIKDVGLVFKSVSGFDIGANNYAVWLDIESLPYNTFVQDYSNYNDDIVKNGYGLIASAVNGFTFSVNQLENFLANNQNYFITRNATEKVARTENVITGVFGIAQGITQTITGMSTLNPVATATGITKTTTSLTNALLKEENLKLSRANSDRHLADLANAPESLLNTSSVVFQSALQQVGFYLSFYKATERDINNLLNDFICRGLPINRYVTTAEARKYLVMTTNAFDTSNYKYVKGDIKLTGNWSTTVYVGYDSQASQLFQKAVSEGLSIYHLTTLSGAVNDSSVDSLRKDVYN